MNTFSGGTISYEIHTSGEILETVSAYVRAQTANPDFQGHWMMVVLWDRVHQFSFFSSNEVNQLLIDITYTALFQK